MPAHVYDLTEGKWISQPGAARPDREAARPLLSPGGRAACSSGMAPDAGVSAELGRSSTTGFEHTVLRCPKLSASGPPPSSQTQAGGNLASLKHEIIDGLGTLAALLSLACVALFLLALQ